MSASVSLAWSAWVLAVAWRRRPARSVPLLAALEPERSVVVGRLERWGSRAQRHLPVLAELPATRVGAAIALAVVAAVASVQLMVVIAVSTIMLARFRSIGRQRTRTRLLVGQVPPAVDLLRMGLDAGLTPLLALRGVAERSASPMADELTAVVARVDSGSTLADALDTLAQPGHPLRVVASALVSAERTGVPMAATLERVSAEARAAYRRSTLERVHRLPVLMLLPLVTCVLPAFMLVAVAPSFLRLIERVG